MDIVALGHSVNDVCSRQSSREIVDSYRSILCNCRLMERFQWMDLTNDAVVVQCAWALAELMVTKGASELQVAPSLWKVWFAGFAEGRLPVSIPRWWNDQILGYTWDDGVWKAADPFDAPFKPAVAGMWTSIAVSAVATSSGVEITKDSQKVFVKSEFLEGRSNFDLADVMNIALDGPVAYVAISLGSWSEWRAKLICIRITDSQPIWEQHLFRYRKVAVGGLWHHVLQPVVARNDRIFIFGCEGGNCYFDVFLRDRGECIGRFSTEIHEKLSLD